MNKNKALLTLLMCGLIAFFYWLPEPKNEQDQDGVTIISAATVFNGEIWQGTLDIVFKNGQIIAIGKKDEKINQLYQGATIIDGKGKYLLPGFIDAHTHSWGNALQQAVQYGVTTELDMFTQSDFAQPQQALRTTFTNTQQTDLYSALTLITAPNGHGTEYGFEIPTISSTAGAETFVAARVAEGSDYIKIIYDAKPDRVTSIDQATLIALVKAGQTQGKLVVVHIDDYLSALHAIQAGANGLAHGFMEKRDLTALSKLMKANKSFLIPTLSVLASMTGQRVNYSLLESFTKRGYETSEIQAQVEQRMSVKAYDKAYAQALSNVKLFADAGVLILAGTDAPNPGTAHGLSLHNELEQLVKSGMSPTQALQAATINPAKAFQIRDRGAIKIGLKADFILLDKDPRQNITHTRSIIAVYKNGYTIEKSAASTTTKAIMPPVRLSNFEESLNTDLGFSWITSNDQMMNGNSTVTMKRISDPGYLYIEGSIGKQFLYPWAGTYLSLSGNHQQGIDISAMNTLTLTVKGTESNFRLLLFNTKQTARPLEINFAVSEHWQEITIPLTAISPQLLKSISAICFSAGQGHDNFELHIKDVWLH